MSASACTCRTPRSRSCPRSGAGGTVVSTMRSCRRCRVGVSPTMESHEVPDHWWPGAVAGWSWRSVTPHERAACSSAAASASGSWAARASATARSMRVGPTESMIGASARSTCAAAAGVRSAVAFATRRARHRVASRASTRAWTSGRRCRSSSASAISAVTAAGEVRIAAASGSAANSATPGVPSAPTTGQSSMPSCSPHRIAGASGVGGLRSHQPSTTRSRRRSAARAMASDSWASSSSQSASRSATSRGWPWLPVSIMAPSLLEQAFDRKSR